MKIKCDSCGQPATIHLTEIVDGKKIEKHLCEDCASAEGITVKANVSIMQLLEDFILQTASGQEFSELKCDVCGMTFAEFRQHGQLGCPNDYEAFSEPLAVLLERTHEGASQHIGKVPHRAADSQKRQTSILRLRAQLSEAVAAENYERAAALRDKIKELEEQ